MCCLSTEWLVDTRRTIITSEFLQLFDEVVSFLNDLVLARFPAHPEVFQVGQGKAPHLSP